VLSNAKTLDGGRVVYSCVSNAEINSVNATHDDADGAARYLMNTQGAQVAAFFCEDNEGVVRVSLRSLGYDVGKLAARWGGGGHQPAAGCVSKLPMSEISALMLDEILSDLTL
jgi:phosphoesterase RecJ-like protein